MEDVKLNSLIKWQPFRIKVMTERVVSLRNAEKKFGDQTAKPLKGYEWCRCAKIFFERIFNL